MPDAIRYQLAALCGVQLSLLIKELIHIHALQLSDALLLRHSVIQFIYLLFHINGSITSYKKCHEANYNDSIYMKQVPGNPMGTRRMFSYSIHTFI